MDSVVLFSITSDVVSEATGVSVVSLGQSFETVLRGVDDSIVSWDKDSVVVFIAVDNSVDSWAKAVEADFVVVKDCGSIVLEVKQPEKYCFNGAFLKNWPKDIISFLFALLKRITLINDKQVNYNPNKKNVYKGQTNPQLIFGAIFSRCGLSTFDIVFVA